MIVQSSLRNLILSRLPAEDFALLAGHLEPVRYDRGTKLLEENAPIRHACFLESGVASLITHTAGGSAAETGLIGREGFLHPALALGADRMPHSMVVQLADDAHRIPAACLLEAMEASASLRRALLLFAHVQSVQGSCTALSYALHGAEARLARWLLMCHDRVDTDELALTHDFIAVMMAVRRPTVTNSLHILEGKHLIRSERGMVTVRDRAALEAFAGDSYGRPEAEYRRLLARDSSLHDAVRPSSLPPVALLT